MYKRDHLNATSTTARDAIAHRRQAHQQSLEERRKEARRLVNEALETTHTRTTEKTIRKFQPHPAANLFAIYHQVQDEMDPIFADTDCWRMRPRPDGVRSLMLILPTGWLWVAKSGKVLKSIRRQSEYKADLGVLASLPVGTIIDGVYRGEEGDVH